MSLKGRKPIDTDQEQVLGEGLSRPKAMWAILTGALSFVTCGRATALTTRPSLNQIPRSSVMQPELISGSWSRRFVNVAGSALYDIALAFPGPSGRGVNRQHVHVPASNVTDRAAPDCTDPLTAKSSADKPFLRSPFIQLVAFNQGFESVAVTLSREAGLFTLQSYSSANKGIVWFEPSARYRAAASAAGLKLSGMQQLQLALSNVGSTYVAAAKAAFPDIDAMTIVASFSHG